jgi:hypothetical protein
MKEEVEGSIKKWYLKELGDMVMVRLWGWGYN